MLNGRYFTDVDVRALSSQERHLLVQQLAELAHADAALPVVVYLSAFAGVADDGGVYLLPGDFQLDAPSSRLPLREALKLLAACPARAKLLVLDIMWRLDDPRLGVAQIDLARCAQAELRAVPDSQRQALLVCSPGQAPLISDPLGAPFLVITLSAPCKATPTATATNGFATGA